MDDLIVFFPIWLTSLILFAIIPTQRSEWPQFRIVAFVGKKFLDFAAWVPNWIIHRRIAIREKAGVDGSLFNEISIITGIIFQLNIIQ